MATTSASANRPTRNAGKASLAVLAAAVAVTLAHGSEAAAAGNASAGRDLAQQSCAECHRLPDGTGGGQARALTAYRDQQPFTAAGLRKLIGSWPHAGTVKLPPDQAYPDLAAFLNGIDKTAAAPDRTQTGPTSQTAERPANRRTSDRRTDGFGDAGEADYEDEDDEEYEEHEYEEHEHEEHEYEDYDDD